MRKFMTKKNFVVAVFAFIASFAFIPLFVGAEDTILPEVTAGKEAPPEAVTAADPFNSRLAIQVGTDGRFNIGAFPNPATGGSQAGSWNLTYRWPGSPWSSFTTFRIDGADNNVYGVSGTRIQPPTDIDAKTNQSKWQIGDVEVTQNLQLVLNTQTNQEDVAKISYTVKNTGTVSHTVGSRIMFDTDLNYNDGAPFRVPGDGIITTEKEYLGSAVPDTFTAYYNVTDSTHVAAATLKSAGATAPDRLVFAQWGGVYGNRYDYEVHPGASFTSDSAYAVYWNPTTLEAGESRTYVTFYGLAQLTSDLRPPLALGVSAPATLSVVNNAYSPNPFTVTATILDNGTAPAQNVAVTIHLPAGLSLASGSETQNIGTLPVNAERQVTWSVKAENQSSEKTLTYSIDASADNADTKTLSKQITLPAVHSEKFVYVALGDSYQSGEGAGNSITNTADYLKAYETRPNYPENTYTDEDGDWCHRSIANYAKINRKKLRPDLTDDDIVLIDATCSGATILNGKDNKHTIVGNTGIDSQVAIAQTKLQSLGLSTDDVDLVSVGMGGNDAKFTEVITACLTPNLVRRVLGDYSIGNGLQRWAFMKYFGIDSCEQAINKRFTEVTPSLDTLATKESAAQNIILNTFEKARLLQLNYPSIIPKTNPDKSWCGGIDKADFDYARGIVKRMDGIINEAVRTSALNNPRIEIVDVESAFGNDPLCSDNLANGLHEENFNTEVSRLVNDPVVNPMLNKLLTDVNLDLSCRKHLGIGCDTGTIDTQIGIDIENLKGYFTQESTQRTIFANLAVIPTPGGEGENVRFDRSRGFFHPNANGFAVMACYVRAAFNHQTATGCYSSISPLPDLINGNPVRNAPLSGAPGEQVHIQMSGFAHSAPVHVTFASVILDLGTIMSDADGLIDSNIILPEAESGVHTITLQGNTEGGVGIHKRFRVNYLGRPEAGSVYDTYMCGFTPSSENNLQSDQIDIAYLSDEVIETLTPDEDGCVLAGIPVFDILNQTGVITITARSQTTGKTVTTTIDPIPSVAGLWADSSTDGALLVTGSEMNVTGLTHSNADIAVRGSKNTFGTGVEYVTALTTSGSNNALSSPRKVSSGGLPAHWNIADYRPGGSEAVKAGTNYHEIPSSSCIAGVWSVNAKNIPSGVVYTPCAIQISGSKSTINATIVAEGSIKLSGSSITIGRGLPGVPALLTDATKENALRVDGSDIQIRGTVQALGGQARIAGAKGTYQCGIVAKTIEISGSKNSVVVDDQCITP
jgi:uncharacterized repeat protein (TIGR01451 family)